jgi:UDP-N-acetyl-D-glucosamine dehydrogenase
LFNKCLNIVVVGQGYVGLPIAVQAAEYGHFVIGFDIDDNKITNLKRGKFDSTDVSVEQVLGLQSKGNLKFTSIIDNTLKTDVFIISVPTPLDTSRKPDLSMLKSACIQIGKIIQENTLVINESTSFIGTLRNLIKPIIDDESGLKNIQYSVAPERIDPGNGIWGIKNTPRVIGGLDDLALNNASSFYSELGANIVQVKSPEIAEATKLFENTFRQVNIALVNSLAMIAPSFGTSAHEIIAAANTKPFGFMPFFPSIGVGGHCIPIDPIYLDFSAKNVGLDFKLIQVSDEINVNHINFVLGRIKNYLGENLSSKIIQIAGIAYKQNTSDLRESPALELIKLLKRDGAIVSWHDPLVGKMNEETSSALDPNIDLGLIVSPHQVMDFSSWINSKTPVFDLSSTPKNIGWPKFL